MEQPNPADPSRPLPDPVPSPDPELKKPKVTPLDEEKKIEEGIEIKET